VLAQNVGVRELVMPALLVRVQADPDEPETERRSGVHLLNSNAWLEIVIRQDTFPCRASTERFLD
jgi:hypothetical protein